MEEVKENKARMCPDLQRQFVDDAGPRAADGGLRRRAWSAAASEVQLKHPAHLADVFQYCLMYEEGGLYLDQPIGLPRRWAEVLAVVEGECSGAGTPHAKGLNLGKHGPPHNHNQKETMTISWC